MRRVSFCFVLITLVGCSSSSVGSSEAGPYFEPTRSGEFEAPERTPDQSEDPKTPEFSGEGTLAPGQASRPSWSLPRDEADWLGDGYQDVVFHSLKESERDEHLWRALLEHHAPFGGTSIPLFETNFEGRSKDPGVYGWLVVQPAYHQEPEHIDPVDNETFYADGGRIFVGVEFPGQPDVHMFECVSLYQTPTYSPPEEQHWFWRAPYVWGDHLVGCDFVEKTSSSASVGVGLHYLFRYPDTAHESFLDEILNFGILPSSSEEHAEFRYNDENCSVYRVSRGCRQAPRVTFHLVYLEPDNQTYRVVTKEHLTDVKTPMSITRSQISYSMPFIEDRVPIPPCESLDELWPCRDRSSDRIDLME